MNNSTIKSQALTLENFKQVRENMLADYVTSVSGNDLFKVIFDHLSDAEYEKFASNFYEDDDFNSACFD